MRSRLGGRSSFRLLCALALTAALPLGGGLATAAAAGSPAVLELLGGTGARAVSLEVTKSGASFTLQGDLHVAVRNVSDKSQRLRMLYLRARGDEPDVLPGRSTVATLLSPAPAGGKPEVKAGAVRQLNVRFRLPADAPPDALDGTVAIQAFGPGARRPTEQVTFAVTGRIEPLGDVRFEPATAVVQVTRACLLFDCNTTGAGSVRLRGTGVGQLLASLRAAGQTELTTELKRETAEPLQATLTDLRADPEQPGSATASLRLGSKPAAGKYAGSLPLAPLDPKSASLPVEVRSRVWVPWAVLLIFFGVLAAGTVSQQLGLSRRKRLVRDALARAVGEYCGRHGENFPDGPAAAPLTWDRRIDCPLRDNPEWTYYDELDTPSNIYTAARWARNDADLDEAQTATVTLIVRLKGWLLALSQCRALWELARAEREQPEKWAATNVARDSDLLLRRARHEPVDGAAGSQLLGAVERQTSWHRRFAEAWDLKMKLQKAGGDAGVAAAAVQLDELDRGAPPAAGRTQDQQDDLDRQLEALYAELLALRDRSNRDQATPDVPLSAVPPGQQELQAAMLRSELDSLQSLSAQPQVALTNLGAAPALAAPQVGHEAAEAEATVATTSPEREATRSAASGAGQSSAQPRGGSINPSRLLRRLRFTDIMLSLAILLITSLVYTASVYGDTWGTPADLATAFGAGFLGQLTIKWGLLPIYRSLRLRAAPAASREKAAPETGGATT